MCRVRGIQHRQKLPLPRDGNGADPRAPVPVGADAELLVHETLELERLSGEPFEEGELGDVTVLFEEHDKGGQEIVERNDDGAEDQD